MQLHQSTWKEVEAYLETSKGIVIPIGSTEQHGPTGLLGTDAICPEVIAQRAGAEGGILIGPTFNVGCAQHHMAFTGTITLRPSTMIAALHDWVASLGRHGFEKVYFVNGHGGNVATINAAFQEVYADRSLSPTDPTDGSNKPRVACKLQNWWMLPGMMDKLKKMYPKGHGGHATPSEVAVTYYAYPEVAERVKDVPLDPKIAPSGAFTDAEDYRRKFPDGRIGSDPTLATIEDGKTLVEAAAKALIEDFRKFAADGTAKPKPTADQASR